MYISKSGEVGRGRNDDQIRFQFTTPVACSETAHMDSDVHLVYIMRQHICDSGRLCSTGGGFVCVENSNPLRGDGIAGVHYCQTRDGGNSVLDAVAAFAT